MKAAGGGRFPVGSQTTVAMPAIQYPNGYSVSVQGATVVSAPNAPELVLEQGPGTAPIRVTVTKG